LSRPHEFNDGACTEEDFVALSGSKDCGRAPVKNLSLMIDEAITHERCARHEGNAAFLAPAPDEGSFLEFSFGARDFIW
jgi:hypothetical protein